MGATVCIDIKGTLLSGEKNLKRYHEIDSVRVTVSKRENPEMETRLVVASVEGTRGWGGEDGCAGKGQSLRWNCSGFTGGEPGWLLCAELTVAWMPVALVTQCSQVS